MFVCSDQVKVCMYVEGTIFVLCHTKGELKLDLTSVVCVEFW